MTLKILCAGENISSFQPLKSAFDKEDALIITATSLALAIFLMRKNKPQLIISQPNLVDDKGFSLFYEIKNDAELSEIPLAFFVRNEKEKREVLDSIDPNYCHTNIHFLFPGSKWKSDVLKILT